MATPLATATRLLAALEELVAEETLLLRAAEYVDAVGLRERAGPLVDALCGLAPEFSPDSVFRLRLEDLLDQGEKNQRLLASELERTHEEVARIGQALVRLRRTASGYQSARAQLHSGARFSAAA